MGRSGRFSLLNNLGYFIHGKIFFGNTIMMCYSRYRFSWPDIEKRPLRFGGLAPKIHQRRNRSESDWFSSHTCCCPEWYGQRTLVTRTLLCCLALYPVISRSHQIEWWSRYDLTKCLLDFDVLLHTHSLHVMVYELLHFSFFIQKLTLVMVPIASSPSLWLPLSLLTRIYTCQFLCSVQQ